MQQMTNCVHRLAVEYRDAGLSVIPLRLDGSKAPAVTNWQSYQERLATDEELSQWFSRPAGVGMVAGAVSGGLEVIDFDDFTLFQPWRSLVTHIADRLPVIETPNAGWHVLLRCSEIGGNVKIAMDPSRNEKTLIAISGEGAYVVAEGSPCSTHPTGLPYCQYSGPRLPHIPIITPEERRELWHAARTFDKRGNACSTHKAASNVHRDAELEALSLTAYICQRESITDGRDVAAIHELVLRIVTRPLLLRDRQLSRSLALLGLDG